MELWKSHTRQEEETSQEAVKEVECQMEDSRDDRPRGQ